MPVLYSCTALLKKRRETEIAQRMITTTTPRMIQPVMDMCLAPGAAAENLAQLADRGEPHRRLPLCRHPIRLPADRTSRWFLRRRDARFTLHKHGIAWGAGEPQSTPLPGGERSGVRGIGPSLNFSDRHPLTRSSPSARIDPGSGP